MREAIGYALVERAEVWLRRVDVQRRDRHFLVGHIKHEIETAHVAPVGVPRLGPFFQFRMANVQLTGRATPRHRERG